jgi:predicted transcriptional regulator
MKHLSNETKQQLDWRKSQVLELARRGYSQREISKELHIDSTAVNRDIQFLRQQAQESLQHHIHEVVPEEYQKCMVGMKCNLKQTPGNSRDSSRSQGEAAGRAIVNDFR